MLNTSKKNCCWIEDLPMNIGNFDTDNPIEEMDVEVQPVISDNCIVVERIIPIDKYVPSI